MTDVRISMLAAAMGMVVLACEPPASGTGSGAPVGSGAPSASADAEEASAPAGPRKQVSPLAQDERRVALFVLPGDAQVEVNGQPVRRHHGVVELTGKVGATFSVRARKDDRSTDAMTVTIQESGASPSTVDMNEPSRAAAAVKTKAKPKAFGFND